MKVKLTKLIGGSQIRTDSVDGTTDLLPTVGQPFVMVAESLSFIGGFRLVNTSDVQKVTQDDTGAYILDTLNSTYKLTIEET
jgi:hypothetical protein